MVWTQISFGTVFLLLTQAVPLQLVQRVAMHTYSLSFPAGWYVQREPQNDSVYACNEKDGNCTPARGGLPKAGRITLTVMPDQNHPDHPNYDNDLDRFMRFELKSHRHAQPITELALHPSDSGGSSRCLLIRSLIGGDVWADLYGWKLENKLFRAVATYNDDPKQNEILRSVAIDIISSVRLRE